MKTRYFRQICITTNHIWIRIIGLLPVLNKTIRFQENYCSSWLRYTVSLNWLIKTLHFHCQISTTWSVISVWKTAYQRRCAFILEKFEIKVQFSPQEQRSKSLLVFSSKLDIRYVVKKLCSMNSIKIAADTIRKSLLKTDFYLQNKFGDAKELIDNMERYYNAKSSLYIFFQHLK